MPSSAREFERVERRHDIRAIPQAAADLAEHAGAGVEPRRRDDDRVDERPLDAVDRPAARAAR